MPGRSLNQLYSLRMRRITLNRYLSLLKPPAVPALDLRTALTIMIKQRRQTEGLHAFPQMAGGAQAWIRIAEGTRKAPGLN
jgi:hypothetical protein